ARQPRQPPFSTPNLPEHFGTGGRKNLAGADAGGIGSVQQQHGEVRRLRPQRQRRRPIPPDRLRR
ncbi:hypothetical protein, partial [Elstera litoralis]|uniref:hypothetical protein n=1 Tax=Elstera litoralis TaxID=552518 RepID=UPI0018DD6C6E